MTSLRTPIRLFALAGALALAACGGGKTPPPAAVSAAPAPAPADTAPWLGRDGVKRAITLLNEGKPVEARALLIQVLKQQPGDVVARELVTQIDKDPKELLGTQNYRHTLKEGETLSSVADRALGNPMMFYALARYNDIAVPNDVTPGQVILVPGKAPAPAVVKKAPPKAAPAKPKTSTATAPAAAKPAAPNANPGQAAKLRGQGLAAMNAGAINRAVALLRQAQNLDPANGTIRADLSRALRIQNTVRAR